MAKNKILGLSGIQSKISKNIPNYLSTQKTFEEVESFLANQFQSTSTLLYQQTKLEHQSFSLPGLSAQSFHQNHNFSFGSHLTYTLDNFSNDPHADSDASSYTFGMWLPINKKTGDLIQDKFEIQCGNIVFPSEKIGIDFENFNGVVEVIWEANSLLHHTESSSSPFSSLHTRLGMSVESPLKSLRVVNRLQSGYYDDPSYFFQDVNRLVENSKKRN